MLDIKDREQWRRRQSMNRLSYVVVGLAAVVCAMYLVQNSIVLLRLADASPEASDAVEQAFWLGWNGASQTETYCGYQIWIRDVIGGAMLNGVLLLTVVAGSLLARREFKREERMWAHIESLEKELFRCRASGGSDGPRS